MMHRDGWEGRKANSGMAFAWYVYERGHSGPTVIDRISWRAMAKREAFNNDDDRIAQSDAIVELL
jgi:hypothetical protein